MAMYGFDKANNTVFAAEPRFFCQDSIYKEDIDGWFDNEIQNCAEGLLGLTGNCVCSGNKIAVDDRYNYDKCGCEMEKVCPPAAVCSKDCGQEEKTGLADGNCGNTKRCPATTCAAPTPTCSPDTKKCECVPRCIDATSFRHCTGDKYRGVTIDCSVLKSDKGRYSCQGEGEAAWCCLPDEEGCTDPTDSSRNWSKDEDSEDDEPAETCAKPVCGNKCGTITNSCGSTDCGNKVCTDAGKVCKDNKCVAVEVKKTNTQTPAINTEIIFYGADVCVSPGEKPGTYVGSCGEETQGRLDYFTSGGYYHICLNGAYYRFNCGKNDIESLYKCANVIYPDCTNKCDGADDGCGGKCNDLCPSGKACEAGVCVKITAAEKPVPVKKLCAPGERKCALDESVVSLCNAAGTAWSDVEQCGPLGCINGACVKKPEGFFKCEGVKAGDKCDPNGNKACGWNGSTHCYCQQVSGTSGYKYVFNNNLAAYCKQCSSRETKTGLCDCGYVDNATKKVAVPFGKSYCGSVFTRPGRTNYYANVGYTCTAPGSSRPGDAKIANCIHGMKCVAGQGCVKQTVTPACVALTADIIKIYDYAKSGGIDSNGKNARLKSGVCSKNDSNCESIKSYIKSWSGKYGSSFIANIAKRANDSQDKYLFTNGPDPISCSDSGRPVCLGDEGEGKELNEAYVCEAFANKGTANTGGCLVWNWVNGGGEECKVRTDGGYCEYNGTDPDTGKKIPTGLCAKEKQAPANEIASHVLKIEGNSLIETVTTDLKPDYCIANCFYCNGAGCAIKTPLVTNFKIAGNSTNVTTIDYTVKLIMSRGAAGFQCDAQCWNGSAKTEVVKSEPVFMAAPKVETIEDGLAKYPLADLYACLFDADKCCLAKARLLLKYYDCRNSSTCTAYKNINFYSGEKTELENRVAQCRTAPDSKCDCNSDSGISIGSFSANPAPSSSVGTGSAPASSFSAGSIAVSCSVTQNGSKLNGAKCGTGSKCFYASNGQICTNGVISCAGTANKSRFECFDNGKTLKSLTVTQDGLNCDYNNVVQRCGTGQTCNKTKGVCE